MSITQFKYTILTQSDFENYRLVEIKNIQRSYKTPAWRHTVDYDASAKDYLRRENQKIARFRGVSFTRELIIDLDIKKDRSFTALCNNTYLSIDLLLKEYGLQENDFQIYFSGDNGLHIHIPTKLFGLKPKKRLPQRMGVFVRLLCEKLPFSEYIDYGIYQPNQSIRLPLSPHDETGQYKIPITFERLNNLSLKGIRRSATNPDLSSIMIPQNKVKLSKSLTAKWNQVLVSRFIPKEIKVSGVPDGERHDQGLIVIRLFRAQGFTREETIQKLLAWDKTNAPPMNEPQWIHRSVEDWYSKTKDWATEKRFLFVDTHAPLMHILNHPELNVNDAGVLAHIYYHVFNVEKDWEFIKIMPGSRVFSLEGLSANIGITKYHVRKSLDNLVDNGLIYKLILKKNRKNWGLYITLGPLLRAMKLGREYDINELELPLSSTPPNRWETRVLYLNLKDIGFNPDKYN